MVEITKSSFKLLSSLEKVFFEIPERAIEHTSGSMFKNEMHSFQFSMYLEGSDRFIDGRIEIKSPLKEHITVYKVEYVPSILPAFTDGCADDEYISKKPGMFPDMLKKTQGENFTVMSGQTSTYWIAVEPKGMPAGDYDIVVAVYDAADKLAGEKTYKLHIIDAELPKQTLINTGWFHGDCLAVLHNTETYTPKYWELVEKYLEVYVKFGHNMILTPIFTPPLDTKIGSERPTNQLIDVTLKDGKYSFSFEKLSRWIELCMSHGIEYFEISHLFTQWGAEFTPKIMADADGEYKRIFGWDVAALSEEYKAFLAELMPQLIAFLKEKGVYENCFFHTSDEPKEPNAEQYAAVSAIVKDYVGKDRMMDALSNYLFYGKGLVYKPVVAINHINSFIDNKVEGLWAYYCCTQSSVVANRFMAMPSYKNRILGYQLYKSNIEGFLHWGFNFWFSFLSQEVCNPFFETDAKGAYPSGDPFVVYPLDDNGEVGISLRLFVFAEGLQDMRALQMLEAKLGRKAAEEAIAEVERFDKYPRDAEYILNVREKINRLIESNL